MYLLKGAPYYRRISLIPIEEIENGATCWCGGQAAPDQTQ